MERIASYAGPRPPGEVPTLDVSPRDPVWCTVRQSRINLLCGGGFPRRRCGGGPRHKRDDGPLLAI